MGCTFDGGADHPALFPFDGAMPEQLEPIRHALDAAERELLDRLEESCSMEPEAPGDENTGELIRLEEALSSAARAAEQALKLRRQLRAAGGADRAGDDPGDGVREFRAADGTAWRVWAVRPPRERLEAGGDRFLAEYREGWLAFEALDGSARRRLPSVPDDWLGMEESTLRELLESATPVRPRLGRERPRDDRADPVS